MGGSVRRRQKANSPERLPPHLVSRADQLHKSICRMVGPPSSFPSGFLCANGQSPGAGGAPAWGIGGTAVRKCVEKCRNVSKGIRVGGPGRRRGRGIVFALHFVFL